MDQLGMVNNINRLVSVDEMWKIIQTYKQPAHFTVAAAAYLLTFLLFYSAIRRNASTPGRWTDALSTGNVSDKSVEK